MDMAGKLAPSLLALLWLFGMPHAETPRINKQEPTKPTQEKLAPQEQPELSPDEVVKVDTSLVTVPVSALDRDGHFVSDLKQEDFRVHEDGVEQQIAFFAPVESSFSVVLLIDTSPSTRSRQKEIRAAANAFIEQLRPDDNVMVVTFNSEIHVVNKATRDREALRKAIGNIRWDGSGTLLYGTVDALMNRIFRRLRGRKALVVLTDGQDNDMRARVVEKSRTAPKNETSSVSGPTCSDIPCATYESNMRDAEELDTLIYPIRFSEPIYQRIFGESKGKAYETAAVYLRELAKKTGGRFYSADENENLTLVFTSIANELRHQYSLGYYAKTPAQPGERRQIKVRVTRPNVVVRARSSYVRARH
jgi:Ca-activated chloride channel homolog